ncbi:MAG: hypothetical protein SFT90_01130 [Rickettsiales bacterium]|nr:hypothetical protein [Rickettsiales bacterium]
MKKTIKIFFIIISLMSFNQAFACDLGLLPFGKEYKNILEKYKIETEIYDRKNFELNTRGQKICSQLKNYQVSFLFIDKKFSSIRIENLEKANFKLYKIIAENYGEPINKPNLASVDNSYASYIDIEDYYISYKNSLKDKHEMAIITPKKYLDKYSNYMQNLSEDKEKED